MPNLPAGYQGTIKAAYREVQSLMSAQGAYLLHGLKDIFVTQQLLRGKVVPMERVRFERQFFDMSGSHDAGSFVQQYLYLRVIKKALPIANQITSVGADGVWFLFHPSLIGECESLIHANNWDAKQAGMEKQYQGLLAGKVVTKSGGNPVEAYVKALTRNLTDMAKSPTKNNEVLLGGGASLKHLVAIIGTKSQMAVLRQDIATKGADTKDFNDEAQGRYGALMQNISLKEEINLKKAGPKHFYRGAADDMSAKEKFIVDRINAGRTARGVTPIVGLDDVLFERKDKGSAFSVQKVLDDIKKRIDAHSESPPSSSPQT